MAIHGLILAQCGMVQPLHSTMSFSGTIHAMSYDITNPLIVQGDRTLLLEAQKRGHELFCYSPSDLSFDGTNRGVSCVIQVELPADGLWFDFARPTPTGFSSSMARGQQRAASAARPADHGAGATESARRGSLRSSGLATAASVSFRGAFGLRDVARLPTAFGLPDRSS